MPNLVGAQENEPTDDEVNAKITEIKADYPEAHNNLGVALAQQDKLREAIAHFKKALQLKPDYAQARSNLDNATALLAKTTEP